MATSTFAALPANAPDLNGLQFVHDSFSSYETTLAPGAVTANTAGVWSWNSVGEIDRFSILLNFTVSTTVANQLFDVGVQSFRRANGADDHPSNWEHNDVFENFAVLTLPNSGADSVFQFQLTVRSPAARRLSTGTFTSVIQTPSVSVAMFTSPYVNFRILSDAGNTDTITINNFNVWGQYRYIHRSKNR